MANLCPFEVAPLAVSSPLKSASYAGLSYMSQDYWSFKNRLMELIGTKFEKNFNDFNESSLGVMQVELWSFLADTISFKIDQLANEMFVDTVTEVDNMFRLVKLVGFKPTPPIPARAMFSGSIMFPLTTDLVLETPVAIHYEIPGVVNHQVMELFPADSNGNPVPTEPIIFPAGALTINNVVGIQGNTITRQFKGKGVPNQIVVLGDGYILSKSIRLYVDGILWEEVDSFTENNPLPQYRIEYGPQYTCTIIFGNNQTGLMPGVNSNIQVVFRRGGGSMGNVTTGSIETQVNVHAPGYSQTLTVNFKNYTKGEFGYDGDSIEDIRRKLPIHLSSQNRAVTGEDYQYLAETFSTAHHGAVGKALATLRNAGCSGNIIDLYILAREGGVRLTKPNESLKSELYNMLDKKKIFTDHICIKDGEILLVDIMIDVVLDTTQKRNEETIREKINRRLGLFFQVHNWKYGQSLRESQIVKALADIKEIYHMDVSFVTVRGIEAGHDTTSIVVPKFNEIICPDNLTVSINYKAVGEW